MEYFKKNIFKLCFFWVFTSLLLIPIVSAEEVDVGYVTNKTTVLYENNQAQSMVSLAHSTNVNQYLYNILVIQLNNQTITKDYLYQLEIYTPNAKLKNINNIYIVGGSNNNTTCQVIGLDSSAVAYPKIYFKCPSNLSYLTIGLNNDNPTTLTESITTATNFQWNYTYLRYFTEDTDIDLGPVISNQQQNTQQIIDNQNQLLGSKCPNLINKSNVTNGAITYNSTSNNLDYNTNSLTTGWFPCKPNTQYIISGGNNRSRWQTKDSNGNITFIPDNNVITTNSSASSCRVYYFYDSNVTANSETVPNIMVNEGNVAKPFCVYGSYSSKLDEVSGSINGVTGAITDDDIGNSTSNASDFINNFSTNTFGLTSIVTAPLTLIQSLTSSTCSDLELPLPYLNNKKLTLPCMTTIYSTYFGSFFTMYQTITYGIIAYWVIVRIFNQVKDFKNPEHDEIEVVDL